MDNVFIYLPTVLVRPYRIFGIALFAVESLGADFNTGKVYTVQHAWFDCESLATAYAEQLRSGEID